MSIQFSFAGKWPLQGYDGLRYWVYSARTNKGLFRANTTWGISFSGLPKHWVMNPRIAMPRLLALSEYSNCLADDVDTPSMNQDGMPVIPREIATATDPNQLDIAFLATPEESTDPLLLGVNLEIFDEDAKVFCTVVRSTLLGPKIISAK
jgi:hypothetical protein